MQSEQDTPKLRMIALMREILQDDYSEWTVRMYSLTESLETESPCRITARLMRTNGSELLVEGEGVGSIDALFNGLKQRLGDDYPSLKSIRFSQFSINALVSGSGSGSDSVAEATVGILNSEDQEFIFTAKATSISRAGVEATIAAAEYFVNSEQTFVRLHEILEHYRETGRTDLVDKYTEIMSRVVANTSYSEVVENIKGKMS